MAETSEKKIVTDQSEEKTEKICPLAAYGGEKPPAPAWFERALAVRPETGFTTVKGARIHYLRWGDRSKPGLLLCHGNGAHAHWWDFIAPYFAEEWHVVAMTFSGMGESDWRERYDMDTSPPSRSLSASMPACSSMSRSRPSSPTALAASSPS